MYTKENDTVRGNSPECPPDVEAHDVEPWECSQESEQDAVTCNRKCHYRVLCANNLPNTWQPSYAPPGLTINRLRSAHTVHLRILYDSYNKYHLFPMQ
jgi:hypothetical protein